MGGKLMIHVYAGNNFVYLQYYITFLKYKTKEETET